MLAAVERRLGVAVTPADVTDEEAAQRVLANVPFRGRGAERRRDHAYCRI